MVCWISMYVCYRLSTYNSCMHVSHIWHRAYLDMTVVWNPYIFTVCCLFAILLHVCICLTHTHPTVSYICTYHYLGQVVLLLLEGRKLAWCRAIENWYSLACGQCPALVGYLTLEEVPHSAWQVQVIHYNIWNWNQGGIHHSLSLHDHQYGQCVVQHYNKQVPPDLETA